MLKEMIKTLRSGSYGVDLLAITAVAATLAVGQYWAAMIVLIMLVGGDSLKIMLLKSAYRIKSFYSIIHHRLLTKL